MKRLLIGLVVLALAAGVAGAKRPAEDVQYFGRNDAPPPAEWSPSRDVIPKTFFFDDVESGVNGWTHGDWTAVGGGPKWHVDTYMAFAGSSWWCGTFAYDADGGYGNNWFEFLTVPATAIPGGAYGVWTFCYRYDTEPGYDYFNVQAKKGGSYVTLEAFDGYGAWVDIGLYGYEINNPLDPLDLPFQGRFLFTSDGAWSDADGLWLTVGGACAVDNIKVFDFYGSDVYFYDDVESGGLCVPGQAGAAGDYWHIRYDLCSSWSRPHSWQCVNSADTTFLPPLMQNWLDSPWIDVSYAVEAKFSAKGHFEIPGYYGDYWYVWATFNGIDYYTLWANYGDFGACSGWSTSYNNGKTLHTLAGWPANPEGRQVQIEIAMYTDAAGTDIPSVGGTIGICFDDLTVSGTWEEPPNPVSEQSWGRIKAQYR
ncbi:MAG: hypothetical protein FJY74_04130 [Candidatus Eisenbacteria bacterium]|nr:hypothetical protein [Candidatus Eisenbacteria bacterium]